MHKDTLENFKNWITAFPESYNECDMDRFYNFIHTARINDDLDNICNINWDEVINIYYPDWTSDYKEKFIDEWESNISLCVGLLKYE